jgi:hypothetical protein
MFFGEPSRMISADPEAVGINAAEARSVEELCAMASGADGIHSDSACLLFACC